MFNKNGYKLKSSFRKMLMSTNEIYQYSVSREEAKSIAFMWTEALGDNSVILVSRFQKQGNCFGFRISTNIKGDKYEHLVKDVVKNSDVSENTKIAVDDILLEVNGINVTQLNYSELAILLSALPNNVQFVYAKKENEYEKLDASGEEKNLSTTKFEDGWTSPITIIVQGSRKESDGLDFINNPYSLKKISKCVIQRIKPFGYCFKDKRISVNDSITKINDLKVENYSENEMYQLLQNKLYPVLMICIGKYQTCNSTPRVDYSALSRSQSATIEGVLSNSNSSLVKHKSMSQIITSFRALDYSSETDLRDEFETLSIDIDIKDDLGIYLIDVENKKSIICGFVEKSVLKSKFCVGDEIIKINENSVVGRSSLEIGKLMKNGHSKMEIVTVTVSRGSRPYKLNNSIILPPEMNSDKNSPNKIKNDPAEKSEEIDESHIMFNVTIQKVNNSFGLFIQNCDGPTINKVLPESEIYQNDIIRPGDKIIRINDIYVADKEHDFVLTLIRSCGQSMKLEMSRNNESVKHIECSKNPIYYAENDASVSSSIYLTAKSNQKSVNIQNIRKYIKTM